MRIQAKVVIPDSVLVKANGMISRGVKAAEITEDGHLVLTLTDGSRHDLGEVVGPRGEKGDTGEAFTYADFTAAQLAALKGEKGDKGDKGDTGARGATGATGATGAQGPKGDKGDKGDTGAQGATGKAFTYSDFTTEQLAALKGPKGDKGDKGDTGAKGDKGDTGAAGAKGDKGEPGAAGAKGEKGDKGETGSGFKVLGYYASASALSSAVTSPNAGDAYGVGSGEPYDIYIWDGVNSKWVNNGPLQGAKGDKGDTGAQGPKGDTGAQGATGPQGAQGKAFTYADFTADQLAALKGEKGDKGDTGAAGAKGADGKTPVKGTDYFTEADKAELVEDVIEALPSWEGGAY